MSPCSFEWNRRAKSATRESNSVRNILSFLPQIYSLFITPLPRHPPRSPAVFLHIYLAIVQLRSPATILFQHGAPLPIHRTQEEGSFGLGIDKIILYSRGFNYIIIPPRSLVRMYNQLTNQPTVVRRWRTLIYVILFSMGSRGTHNHTLFF